MAKDVEIEEPSLSQPIRPDGPIVVPAKTANLKVFRYRPDNGPDQTSEHSATLQPGCPSFEIPRRLPFGPLIEKRFAQPQQFTEKDWTTLAGILGADIPDDLRWHIDEACELYVNSIALQTQMAKWKDLRDLLKKIVPAAEILSKSLVDPQRDEPIRGALSAVQTVRSYIHDALTDPFHDASDILREWTGPKLQLPDLAQELTGSAQASSDELEPMTDLVHRHLAPSRRPTASPQGLNRLLPDLQRLIALGKPALQNATKTAGNEKQAELRLFLETLDNVATTLGPTTTPWHGDLEVTDPNDESARENYILPAFFRFVRAVLRLATDYGAPAILATALSPEEKKAALKTLSVYAEKKDKALSVQLERIRARNREG